MAHVLSIGGGVLVEEGLLGGLWRGQVQATVAIVAAAVLFLHVRHLLPQLLKLCWIYA